MALFTTLATYHSWSRCGWMDGRREGWVGSASGVLVLCFWAVVVGAEWGVPCGS